METLQQAPAVRTPQAKARLLFVDDEEGIVGTLRAIFRLRYDVRGTVSVAEALEIVKGGDVHVVVSDQRMPEMLGVEFLAKVRELSPNTVRILLTGYSDLSDTIEAINSGEIFRYVTKPWDHKDLKETVAEAVEIALKTWQAEPRPVVPAVPDVQSPAATRAQGPASPVIVLDDNRHVAAEVSQLLGDRARVCHAASIAKALQLLGEQDIALVVADGQVGGEDTVPFLRVLKQQHPLIQSVMLTDLSDAELVIRLINQVQVYRVASKPIRLGALKLSLLSALRQHELYAVRPELLARHAVQQVPADEALLAPLRQSIAGKLKSLLGRFMFFRST
jgi:DNA-binding NtrC family response regulator